MILQALTRHYEALLARGEISRPGWGSLKVSYGLELDDSGALVGVLPLRTEQQRGEKSVIAPRAMEVPMPVKRSSGVSANFLCDNSGYLLGFDDKGKPKRTAECFEAAKALHLDLLGQTQSPGGRAVAAFFQNWNPADAPAHPALVPVWEELLKGANLIFWYRDAPVSRDPEVRALWQAHYDQGGTDSAMRCLVTGQLSPCERIHPAIKGVAGAQTVGAALVSFNGPSFESFEHVQGENAPIGTYAAFAYTTALNHLLADRAHVQHIGDTTVLCWAEGGDPAYQALSMAALYDDNWSERDILSALRALSDGDTIDWGGAKLDPSTRFYVLGLAPNAARLSVRFFWQNSFGTLAANVRRHYDRLRIVRPSSDRYECLSIWRLSQETVNRNARNPSVAPQLAGDLLRAVLSDGLYPATLLNGTAMRIRAEREITRGRAAILKAYYLKNKNEKCPEEVLTVELNEQSCYLPYVLGRLFSVLEAVQRSANPDINTTIKDKYFNAASATPSVIFPLLVNLSQKHMRKLSPPLQVHYNKQITELLGKVDTTYPARMTLPEQGAFQLGYYHQTQKRYTKKEEQ